MTKNEELSIFHKTDKKIFHLLKQYPVTIKQSNNYFVSLCESIVCQQLSGKAAAAIWKRFQTIVGVHNITPEYIVTLDDLFIKTSGISGSKARYVKNIASAFLSKSVTPKKFRTMEDESIIEQLVQIKGIGRWTAEMFLMFSMGRDDVFSCQDLGLRKGVQKILGMKMLPSQQTMIRISKKWSPYRTYAALVLWKSLDNV